MLESLGGSNLFSAATPFKNMEPFHIFQEVTQSLPAIQIEQLAKFNLGDNALIKKN